MLTVAEDARTVFPGLEVHALRIDGYTAAAARVDMAKLDRRIAEALDGDTVRASSWRPVYRRMGLKPSRFLSSVEALTRRARREEGSWKSGMPGIDLYNALSIIYGAPMGCYDADRISGRSIEIRRIRRGSDRFTPVGGPIDASRGGDDLIVYATGDDILCWALNHRDSDDFCLVPETRTAIVTSEGTTPDQVGAARSALVACAELLRESGAGVEWIAPLAVGASNAAATPGDRS
ncbi:MAG: phenylalanine--tRNA ligase beta subunit-related protein [Azospirillaceae bacterium]